MEAIHLVLVPKQSSPSALNDLVALASHIGKALGKTDHLRPLASTSLDPLQFASRPEVGVEDAIIYLLQPTFTWTKRNIGS